MKTKIRITLIALFIAVTSVTAQTQNNFILLNKSKLSFENTLEHIKTNAAELGWKVPAVHDLKKSVSKAGFDVLPATVIEVCNPNYAGKILEDENARIVTPMMPVRFSVYENIAGEVIIARMNSKMVGHMFNKDIADKVIAACSNADKIIEEIIK